MKVKLGVWIYNLGDGSAVARIFESEKAAQKYADRHERESSCCERLCDDIHSITLEFDKNGNLLNPHYDPYDFE